VKYGTNEYLVEIRGCIAYPNLSCSTENFKGCLWTVITPSGCRVSGPFDKSLLEIPAAGERNSGRTLKSYYKLLTLTESCQKLINLLQNLLLRETAVVVGLFYNEYFD
jgi:hypothetical protein